MASVRLNGGRFFVLKPYRASRIGTETILTFNTIINQKLLTNYKNLAEKNRITKTTKMTKCSRMLSYVYVAGLVLAVFPLPELGEDRLEV